MNTRRVFFFVHVRFTIKQCSKHVSCAPGHSDEHCQKVLAITANTCLTNGWKSLQKWCNYSLNQDVPSAVCVCIIRQHKLVLSHAYRIPGASVAENPP